MNQLSLFEGRRLKREGMDLTSAKNSEWMRERLEDLRSFIVGREEWTMEVFRHYCALTKRPNPSSNNAWGALTHAAVRARIMVWTGRYMNALSTKTHAHPVKVWRAA